MFTKSDLKKTNEDALTNFKYNEAIRVYERYAKTKPLSSTEIAELGLFYDHRALKRRDKNLRQQDEEKAIRLYEQALKEDPRCYAAMEGMGRVYWHRKDPRAVEYYKKALKLYPKSKLWLGYENLGNVHFALKDYKQSETNYLRALNTGGAGNQGLLSNIAHLYWSMKNFDKAQEFAKKALNRLHRSDIPRDSASFKLIKKHLENVRAGHS